MQKIDTVSELQSAIQVLESRQKEDFNNLKTEFIDLGEHIKPVNLIKEGLNQALHSPVVKRALIVAGTSIVTGFIIHKLVSRKSGYRDNTSQYSFRNTVSRQVKRASFSLFQYVIAAVISQNTDRLKQVATSLLTKPRKKHISETEVSGQNTTE